MIEGRNIICFANDWHGDPTSKHQIMRLLSASNRVLWINSIGLRKPGLGGRDARRIAGKLRAFASGLERIHDNLYVFTPVVIPFHRAAAARTVNAAILRGLLGRYARRLEMHDIICWSYLPNAGYIIAGMKPRLVVYHCVDEWSKFSFIDENIVEQERELCGMADLVLASARSLYESRKPFNEHTYYVSHGVDYRHFHDDDDGEAPLPADMAGIGRPIVGFFGLIHEWIDLDLLEHVVARNPEASFVFIGECAVDVGRFAAYKNARFLGRKSYEELVSYAKRFDVGLIPFKVNELTINVNPIKLKEYLALGIPVVSVNLPEIAPYGHVVRVCGDYESFDRALKDELSGRRLASREDINRAAERETWERKVEEISTLVAAAESRARKTRRRG